MKKIIINKKFLIIAVILIFGIAIPQFASADLEEFFQHAGNAIIQSLAKLLTKLLTWVVNVAADFFEAMLDVGFKGHQKIAKIGWDVSRDVANMFFILFMVIIAFATILRFDKYGIKELLPKVIIIALLINFSMVICYVVIDFTNIVAYFFIHDAQEAMPGQKLTISAILSDSFKLPDLFIPMVCEKYLTDRDKCYNLLKEASINPCVEQAEGALNDCYASVGENQKTEEGDFWDVVVAAIGSSAVLLIAAFVMAAGGILLVIRLVMIWFLVMIAPLAFICYILPALKKNWEAWWSQFIRWCLFAPAYAFFIWLACKITLEDKLQEIASMKASITMRSSEAVNAFFSSTGNILQFLFICGLLVGGLLAANQLGIKGASTAMTLGKKWAGTAKGWAKKQAMKPVKGIGKAVGERAGAGAGMLRGGAMATMGKMFGGKIGGRMAARGAQIKQSAAERAYNKKYAAMLKTASNETVLKEVETAMGSRKLIAAQTAQSRGILKTDATPKQAKAAAETFRKFGAAESAKQLEESRLDIIEGVENLAQTIQRLATEGNLDKISAASFNDNRVVAEIIKNTTATQQESITKRSKQHLENFGNTLKNLTDTASPAYSSITSALSPDDKDKIYSAYASTKDADMNRLNPGQQEKWANSASVDALKNLQITATMNPDTIANIANALQVNKLGDILEKMNDGKSAHIFAHFLSTGDIDMSSLGVAGTPVSRPVNAASQKMARENPFIKGVS